MSKEFFVKKLDNGMRILSLPVVGSKTVTVMVLVGTGSNHELPGEEGISHFLEHMCFKGTKKRPKVGQISLELDSLGAQSNAFTSSEMTGYYAKGDPKHLKKFVDIVSDIYLNSTFPDQEIEKEKGVIIEEINMYEDNPASVIDEKMQAFMYGDHRAGLPVIGTKESVKSFTRADFLHYHARRYAPQNTVFVVAGPVNQYEVNALVSKYFAQYQNKSFKESSLPKVTWPVKKNPILAVQKKTDQVHAIIGFPGFKAGDNKNKKARLLAGVLGSGMSSRLFNVLREELGVCYYVYANQNNYSHSGRFLIHSGITKEKVPMVLERILVECKKLKDELVNDKELKKVKNYIIGNTKMSLESTDDIAYFYGTQLLLRNEIKNLATKIKDVQSIGAKDIQHIARTIFSPENVYIGLIGEKDFMNINSTNFKKML